MPIVNRSPYRRAMVLALLVIASLACAQAADVITMSRQQLQQLHIQLADAEPAQRIAIVSVPAMIEPPVGARVAVTAPFPGIVRSVRVVSGQAVTKGQTLAQVMSREVLTAGTDLASAQAQLTLEQTRAARTRKLVQAGVIAQARADEAQAALAQARSQVTQNQRLLTIAHADGQSGLYTLVAPIAGKISAMNISTGAKVGGDKAPFVVDATDQYALTAQLPARYGSRVHPGMQVKVGDQATGTIQAVASTVDTQTRSLQVKASLPASSALQTGTAVSAQIIADPPAGAIQVPASALVQTGDRWLVYQQVAKGFQPRRVRLFAHDDKRAVITQGLPSNARVAVSSVTEIRAAGAGQ